MICMHCGRYQHGDAELERALGGLCNCPGPPRPVLTPNGDEVHLRSRGTYGKDEKADDPKGSQDRTPDR